MYLTQRDKGHKEPISDVMQGLRFTLVHKPCFYARGYQVGGTGFQGIAPKTISVGETETHGTMHNSNQTTSFQTVKNSVPSQQRRRGHLDGV